MSNSSQVSNAERSAAKFHYRKKLDDNKDNILRHESDPFVQEWRKKKGEYLLERMEIYEELYNLGDYDKPLNTICAQVTNDLVSWGLDSDIEGRWCRKVAPKKYKNESFDRGHSGINSANDDLTAVPLDNLKELDDERLRDFIKKSKADTDHALFEATNRGLAVVGEGNRDPKVSTYLPQEMETDFYYSLLDLADQSTEFTENILAIAQKVKQFPIKDPEKNKLRALQTRGFAQFFYGLNQRMLPSLHDLKWAFSDWEWFSTCVKEDIYSKHGAAVKSKVAAVDKDGNPTGEERPLVRERVGDVKEELWQDMQDVALSFDIGRCLLGLVAWHDIEGQVAARVADRRIRLSPKLSSTAFGADSGKEFSDE